MAEISLESVFSDIASAIREKSNSTKKITPVNMASEIRAITTEPKKAIPLSIYYTNNIGNIPKDLHIKDIKIYNQSSENYVSINNVETKGYIAEWNIQTRELISINEGSIVLNTSKLEMIYSAININMGLNYDTLFNYMSMFGLLFEIDPSTFIAKAFIPHVVEGTQIGYGLALDIENASFSHTICSRAINSISEKDSNVFPMVVFFDSIPNTTMYHLPGENID